MSEEVEYRSAYDHATAVPEAVREAARTRADAFRARAREMLERSQAEHLPALKEKYLAAAAQCLPLSEQELRVAESRRGAQRAQ